MKGFCDNWLCETPAVATRGKRDNIKLCACCAVAYDMADDDRDAAAIPGPDPLQATRQRLVSDLNRALDAVFPNRSK